MPFNFHFNVFQCTILPKYIKQSINQLITEIVW